MNDGSNKDSLKERRKSSHLKQEKPYFLDKPWLPDPSTWRGTWKDDWRIMGQEGYLMDKVLQHRVFDRGLCKPPDFDQCDFCFDVFDEDPSFPKNAYFEPIEKTWICEKCFEDFKEHFHWIVEDQIE